MDFLLGARLRFLEERVLGLDLYHSGLLGQAVFCLGLASATVFLLAIFQVVPRRRHAVGILLGLGLGAALLGLAATYGNYCALIEHGDSVVREGAGTMPVEGSGQEAAVVALPLLLGVLTLAGNVAGAVYISLFRASGESS